MKIGRNQKIEAICSKDETRQHLCSPYLDLTNPADPRLVATDGHAMVALKVEEPDEHDATGHVSIDALKALVRRDPARIRAVQRLVRASGWRHVPAAGRWHLP
jgi:hypothetical protein